MREPRTFTPAWFLLSMLPETAWLALPDSDTTLGPVQTLVDSVAHGAADIAMRLAARAPALWRLARLIV